LIDWYLFEFYKGLDIKHDTSSIQHPQVNDKAKVTNKVILTKVKEMVGNNKRQMDERISLRKE